jgi:YbbR domain-containing protein
MAKRKWITEDFNWKIFSVILAVVVWLTVNKIRNNPGAPGLLAIQNTFTNLPVLAVSASAEVQDARIAPEAVSVTVSGAPGIMAVLETNRLHAIVDLTGIDSAHNLKWRVAVAPPPGVTLLKIDPPEVAVTIPANK